MRYFACLLLLPVIFACLRSPLFAQSDLLIYSEHPELSWADFQGPSNDNTENWAETRSGVKYSYNALSRDGKLELTFEVYSYFDRTKSWTKVDEGEKALLGHELLHFKISELSARKLRKSFAEFEYTRNFQEEVKALFRQSIEDRKAMQSRYDQESDHSRYPSEQARWERHVNAELEKLSDFADQTVVYKE